MSPRFAAIFLFTFFVLVFFVCLLCVCAHNFVKYGRAGFFKYASGQWTDTKRQAHRNADFNTFHPYRN